MAKLVDATDLIGLSLGMETYQVITFKFRETLELKKMGNPEPNPVFWKQTRIQDSESDNKKESDRCRDSMEAVLKNGVGFVVLIKESLHRNYSKGWRIK